MSPPSDRIRVVVGMVVIGAILAAAVLTSPSAVLAVSESVAADPYAFGVFVAGLYLVRPLIALPTTPLAVVVGYGYGVALGIPVALLGVVTTVIPVFLVARWFAGTGRSDPPTPASGPLTAALERAGSGATRYYDAAGPIRGVVVSRLVPIPSDVATCAAAASRVRLRHLVVGTAIGELPWTVAAVIVGASAATVTTGGLGELGLALTVACGLAAVALLAGPAYRAVRTRRRRRASGRSVDRHANN